MKDLSRASVPFTFEDLGAEQKRAAEARLCHPSFRTEASEGRTARPRPPEVDERRRQPAPILEDMARKAFEDAYVQGEKAATKWACAA